MTVRLNIAASEVIRENARPRPPPILGKQLSGTARPFGRRAVMAWIMLFVAGLLEVVWAFSMKPSDGRSEGRRAGIEVVSQCRIQGSLDSQKKTTHSDMTTILGFNKLL